MRRIAWGAVACFALSALGCSSSAPVPVELGVSHEAITHGSPDTTHQAVLFMYDHTHGTACSGTVIAVSGTYGYFLTAAHCVLGEPSQGIPAPTVSDLELIQGNNVQDQSDVVYPVVDFKADPSYQSGNQAVYDFAMVKFNGAGSSTPTMPVLTAALDNLQAGSAVQFVGYGITSAGQQSNSVRMYANNTLANTAAGNAVEPLTVSYSEAGSLGGPCSGDSGGPALYTVNGTQYVAAVTSYGDQSCTQFGVSGRVSAVVDNFINPYITGNSGGTQTCDQCEQAATTGVGACSSQVTACENDSDCSALLTCLNACASGDQTCVNTCASQHTEGTTVYSKIGSCMCTTACKTECASDPSCQGAACGFSFSDQTCSTCMDGSCCSAEQACANDTTCTSCVTSQTPPASCDTNSLANALIQCYTHQCGTACGSAGKCGFTSSNATCQTCFENSCCSQSQACFNDATCTSCVTSSAPAASCSSNALATAFSNCIQQSCNSQCGGGDAGTDGGIGVGSGGSSGLTGGQGGSGGATVHQDAGAGANSGTGANSGSGGSNGSQSSSTNVNQSGGCSLVPGRQNESGSVGALFFALAALVEMRRRRR
jgi:hypothetical protein